MRNRQLKRSQIGRAVILLCAGIVILSAPARAGQTTLHKIAIGGQSRSYALFIPNGAGGPLPAVILLHGGGSSAAGMEHYSGFDALAEKSHIAAVYPDGIGHQWNDGRGKTGGQTAVDDRGFIRALIASLESSGTIDPRRVYVAGISNGGMMALAIACNLPEIVAGAGVVAASQPTDADCPAPRPLPIIFMHGTADRLVPFGGGKIIPNGLRDRGAVLSDAITAAFWQKRNNCGAARSETLPDAAGDRTTVRVDTYACPPGNGVVNIIIEGGGHAWPGAHQGIVADRILGLATHNLDANETMWRFFEAQISAAQRK